RTGSASSAASSCIHRGSIASTWFATARFAGPSSTTCAARWEKGPGSRRSVRSLDRAVPPAGQQKPKRPKRPKPDRDLWVFERQAFGLGYATVAGVDEAGRGPWAGPVVAGAAIMRPYFHCEGIDDSKLLTAEERDHYYDCILDGAEAWGVGIVEVDEIDRVGVSRANRWAMGIALHQRSFISIRTRAELEAAAFASQSPRD